MLKMVKDKTEFSPVLVKFGMAFALSFAGFLYSRTLCRRLAFSKRSPAGLRMPLVDYPCLNFHGDFIFASRIRL